MVVSSTETCTTCGTLHLNLPVERDEEGGYVEIQTVACKDCRKLLCNSCGPAPCDGCGATVCQTCMITVPDGTHAPMHLCAACWLESAELFLAEPECECQFAGDSADASACEVHGSYRRPPAVAVALLESASDFLLDEGVA